MKKTKKLVLTRETLRSLENVAGGALATRACVSFTGPATCCDYTMSCPEWNCTSAYQ
jgi:hypothetical protein